MAPPRPGVTGGVRLAAVARLVLLVAALAAAEFTAKPASATITLVQVHSFGTSYQTCPVGTVPNAEMIQGSYGVSNSWYVVHTVRSRCQCAADRLTR